MADEAGICNSALSKIGASRIVSLTEGSKSANFCAEQYPKIRDKLLRRHIWNFAVERAKLAKISTAPVSGFDNQYQLPSDWLRTIAVHDNDAGVGTLRYKMENRKILTNADEVWLRYIKQIIDANEMTSDFVEALASALAREAAIPLANSNTLKKDMADEHLRDLRVARSTDAIEDFPDDIPEGSWVNIRHGALDVGTR